MISSSHTDEYQDYSFLGCDVEFGTYIAHYHPHIITFHKIIIYKKNYIIFTV